MSHGEVCRPRLCESARAGVKYGEAEMLGMLEPQMPYDSKQQTGQNAAASDEPDGMLVFVRAMCICLCVC
jgi:hypothetical protein